MGLSKIWTVRIDPEEDGRPNFRHTERRARIGRNRIPRQPDQAAAIANQLRAAATPNLAELATKADIAILRAEFYRALLPTSAATMLQAGAIIAATVALVKLIPDILRRIKDCGAACRHACFSLINMLMASMFTRQSPTGRCPAPPPAAAPAVLRGGPSTPPGACVFRSFRTGSPSRCASPGTRPPP